MSTEAMKRGFGFPLPLAGLLAFRHPRPGHVYGEARWHEGEALVCNGYVALRARKGRWLAAEFAAATADFLERFFALPWGEMPSGGNDWRASDEARHGLYKYRLRSMAGAGLREQPAVRVGGTAVVALATLQWAGRLPRCELWAGAWDRGLPLPLRFSGGVGLIAQRQEGMADFSIFEPRRHEDGTRLERRGPRMSLALPGWPPVDESDRPTIV